MGKAIVLFSDGTGNSAAKLFKTNVWRTYQAVDLSAADQIAKYDDGVGTSSFRPLAVLGGAFGWGLKRNVLDLYKYVCRNYSSGDLIYGFGFSRGAFTIRVLVGLIDREGLVDSCSEGDLNIRAADAYRAFRAKCYGRRVSLALVGRPLRNALLYVRNRLLGITPYNEKTNRKVESIRFLGLWDTVDAYGMPIKELKQGIDRYIWPMSFEGLKLTERVEHACHALSLDDERETFHPLVWDETSEPPTKGAGRIQQVWFSGVHSNVGGGYPDDALSHVPLLWIIRNARIAGLRFKQDVINDYEIASNPVGKMYDSRAGVSAYYRYSPRRVDHANYPRPAKIHESVLFRMAVGDDSYAPVSLSREFEVVVSSDALSLNGSPLRTDQTVTFEEFQNRIGGRANVNAKMIEIPRVEGAAGRPELVSETVQEASTTSNLQESMAAAIRPNQESYELVRDTVWWRGVAYWLMVSLTTILFALRWASVPLPSLSTANQILEGLHPVANLVKGFTPSFIWPWIDAFFSQPWISAGLLLAVVATYVWGDFLEGRIRDRARAAWNLGTERRREAWFEQSRRRWHFGTSILVVAAIILGIFAVFSQ
jgi:uncharacterized protein (DUF2235 family)